MARFDLGVSLLLVASFAASQQSQTPKFHSAASSGLSMPMVAPLFLEDSDFSSTVTLVNDAVDPMQARVVVLDANGSQVAYKELQLAGHTSSPIQLHDLLTESGSAANVGSVLVIPEPVTGMPIGGQLSITARNAATPAYIEEEMLTADEGQQGVYRTTALDVKGSPIIALKSQAQGVQAVTLQCFSEKTVPTTGTVQLLAGQLLLVSACDTTKTGRSVITDQINPDVSQVDRGSVGIAVTTSGTPADLIAYGFAVYKDDGGPYFSSLNLTNPATQTSSNTIFTGIPTGVASLFPGISFHPEVAITNFSTLPASVVVVLAHTSGGATSSEIVQKLTLSSHSSRTVPIPTPGDPAMTNSLIVRSNLSPGDVVSQFIAWGDSSVRSVEMQAKDNDSPQNGGGHPWTIEPGTTSTLLLFNHSASGSKRFNVIIGSGDRTWQQSYQLASMETKAISINDIVANQVADEKGRVLSKDAVTGQVTWFTRSPKWGKGRMMVSQPQIGLARSFSCGSCTDVCPGLGLITPYADLSTGVGSVGPLGNLIVSLCSHVCTPPTCTGTKIGTTTDVFYTWSSLNTSISTVSGGTHSASANFLGVAPGSTSGKVIGLGDACQVQATGPVIVSKLTCTPSAVTRASTVNCTVTSPGGSTFSSWKFTDSNNNVVTGNGTTNSWSGKVVTAGSVSVQVTTSGHTTTLSTPITVNNRTNFAFTSVSPAQVMSNTLTCYTGSPYVLSSPPSNGSQEGFSCADLAYSFNFATISDNGPNDGYEYVTSASDSSGGLPTKFEYVVVSDLLSVSTSFYTHQCGTYSSANTSGFIAGSQLKQNVLDHEQGSVFSHWTEYRDAQNNSSNNIGSAVEAAVGVPGSSGKSFATTFGDQRWAESPKQRQRSPASAL